MHYANPKNQFWSLMREVEFIPANFGAKDDCKLIDPPFRIGFTNIVAKISTHCEISPDQSMISHSAQRLRQRS